MKKSLLVFLGIILIITGSACSSNDNSKENSKAEPTRSSEKKTENSLEVYPSDEWHFGKMDIPGFMAESDGNEAKALENLSLVSKLGLSKYFSDNTGNFEVEITKEDENFYAFSLINTHLKNKEELKTFEKNVQALMNQKPVNQTINLYVFTATIQSNDPDDYSEPVVLSYSLTPDGTISKD